LACTACSKDGPRVGISGTVIRDGQPIEAGKIVFTPSKGTPGPTAGAEITDGSFRIPANQGPHEGLYTATVTPGSVPRKGEDMREFLENRGQPFKFDCEIRRDDPEIDIVLPPLHH
jgi:hypothetical protein